MTIHPIRDIKEYKRLKESVKNIFDSERSGEQVFQREQTKTFQPLIDIQKETSKNLQDKIVSGQEATSNLLVPIAQDITRRKNRLIC